jgi:hypothetical protein
MSEKKASGLEPDPCTTFIHLNFKKMASKIIKRNRVKLYPPRSIYGNIFRKYIKSGQYLGWSNAVDPRTNHHFIELHPGIVVKTTDFGSQIISMTKSEFDFYYQECKVLTA